MRKSGDSNKLDGQLATYYAKADHNHNLVYAAATHNHDNSYAAATHNHDNTYLGKTATAADSSKVGGYTPSLLAVGPSVAIRDANGDITARYFIGALNGNAATATTAANANKLIGKNWNWSGQGGQRAWMWGGSDGENMYVYNPANFSVNYANSAGSANSVSASVVGAATTGLGAGDIGSYAFLRDQTSATYGPGTLVAGSQLRWGDHDSALSIVGFGTWRCMGYVNNIGTTVFLRIA